MYVNMIKWMIIELFKTICLSALLHLLLETGN